MSANGGEVPRFRDAADGSTIPQRPPLAGEHGRLAEWFEGAIRTVEHEVKDIRDRLSRMDGAKASEDKAAHEWRERTDAKLDSLLGRPTGQEESTGPRPWWASLLTERTLSQLTVVGMAVLLVWFLAADRFGIENVDRSIDHHIGRDVPAAK